MPHVVVTGESTRRLREPVDLGSRSGLPLLRCQRLPSGDAVVIAPGGGRIDGRPMVGSLAVVDWGGEALVRAAGLRVELRWVAAAERRAAAPGTRCALDFGAFEAAETVVACPCESVVHVECASVMITCPNCGAPVDDAEAAP